MAIDRRRIASDTPTSIGAQPVDADLTTIAGLTATTDNVIQSVAGAWASRTPTQVKTALSLDQVTNTSDVNKPISTATQTALDGKQHLDANLLTTGEATIHRDNVTASCSTTTGLLRLVYFTARKTETTTQVRVTTSTTAAAATPTLCRIGLYTIDGAGAGTLVASIANDTTLFAATLTAYTRSWSVAYAKVAGQRYAVGVLVVSGAATPTLTGVVPLGGETLLAPTRTAHISGQTDLPASFVAGSLLGSGSLFYAAILP